MDAYARLMTWARANDLLKPAHQPAMEIYLKRPEEIGWETFDIECCVPISPLSQ